MIWKQPDHPTSYPQWNFSTNLPAEAASTPVARLCHSASLSKGWDLIDRYGKGGVGGQNSMSVSL
jgi:hypothetical protein